MQKKEEKQKGQDASESTDLCRVLSAIMGDENLGA